MALDVVSDYISDARTLLQDTIAPYRYDDPSLITALNVTMLEARRIRADLFVYDFGTDGDEVPAFLANDNTAVVMEYPFRLAIVYGLVAHALSRDQEDIQDKRASDFMQVFNDMLLGLRPSPIGGGAPAPARR